MKKFRFYRREGVKKSMEFSILRIGWFEKVIFHKKMVKNCLKLPKCSFNKNNLFFNFLPKCLFLLKKYFWTMLIFFILGGCMGGFWKLWKIPYFFDTFPNWFKSSDENFCFYVALIAGTVVNPMAQFLYKKWSVKWNLTIIKKWSC